MGSALNSPTPCTRKLPAGGSSLSLLFLCLSETLRVRGGIRLSRAEPVDVLISAPAIPVKSKNLLVSSSTLPIH